MKLLKRLIIFYIILTKIGINLLQNILTPTEELINSFNEVGVLCISDDGDCNFSCYNTNDLRILPYLSLAKIQYGCHQIKELQLHNHSAVNKKLSNFFLSLNRIDVLRIYDSDINEIDQYALRISNLTELELNGLQLVRLNAFIGLRNLKILKIYQKHPVIEFEKNFLQPFRTTLNQLTIQNGLAKLGGLTNMVLPSLLTVDFSNNNFEKENFFGIAKFPNILKLNLSNSNVNYIPSYTFRTFKFLKILDLSKNNLGERILVLTTFLRLQNIRDLKIYLSENNFKCNYQYQKLIDTFDQIIQDRNAISCDDVTTKMDFFPTNLSLYPVTKSISSSDEEQDEISTTPLTKSSTESTTSSSSTTISPNINPSFDEISCRQSQTNRRFEVLRKQDNFSTQYLPDATLKIDFENQNAFRKRYGLLWFSRITKDFYKMSINYKKYGLGCQHKIIRPAIVSGLNSSEPQIFCVIASGQNKISPFDCVSHFKVMEPDEHSHIGPALWISKEMKAAGIIFMIFGVGLFIFCGGAFVFCYIRRKPSFLRGRSKRVAGLNKNCSGIIVFPRGSPHAKNYRPKDSSRPNHQIHRTFSAPSTVCDYSYMHPQNIYETLKPTELPSYDQSNFKPITKRNSNDPLPEIPKDLSTPIFREQEKDEIYLKDFFNI